MINIICVLKSGGVYNYDYVINLYRMVENNISSQFNFVCYSDIDFHFKNDIHVNPLEHNLPGWWSKLEIFKTAGTCIYVDLDTIICGSLEGLVFQARRLYQNEFIGLKEFSTKKRQNIDTIFASGLMAWNGDFSWVLSEFLAKYKYKELQTRYNKPGDQVAVSAILRYHNINIRYWQDLTKGICSYKDDCRRELPGDAKVVCFYGLPKPHEVVNTPWIKKHWRGNEGIYSNSDLQKT